jgi:hypothetical protein
MICIAFFVFVFVLLTHTMYMLGHELYLDCIVSLCMTLLM